MRAAVLLPVLFFLIAGTAAGMVPAGEPVTASETIFVGEWFADDYTLEFDTELTDAVWHMKLITQNRTTREWDFPYAHAEISGFTISVPEHDTWLETSVAGTPSARDEGNRIVFRKMQVKMANGGVRDTFATDPVLIGPKTTVPETPTTAPRITETVSPPASPVPATGSVPETVRTLGSHGTYAPLPVTEPVVRDSSGPECSILLILGIVCLPIRRKIQKNGRKMSAEQ